MKKTVASILLVCSLSGCATIVSGRTQDVMIRSMPSGATVYIDEIAFGTTPLVANLIRKKRHSIKIVKDGYQEVSRATTRGFNWWYIGNVGFGGIIGLIVDPCTGAIFSVEPDEINATLPESGKSGTAKPVGSAAASTGNATS